MDEVAIQMKTFEGEGERDRGRGGEGEREGRARMRDKSPLQTLKSLFPPHTHTHTHVYITKAVGPLAGHVFEQLTADCQTTVLAWLYV